MLIEKYRQSLVPLWIKVFGWLFVGLAPVAIISFLIANFTMSGQTNIDFLGFKLTSLELTPNLIAIIVFGSYFAFCTYGLLKGKSWAVNTGLVNGYLGLGLCLYYIISHSSSDSLTLRFEPFLQIPFLIVMHSIRKRWSDAKNKLY
ncbi:MAG: hypothetical protein JKY55_14685 [Aliivibrio sp.]|uniref:hypothetical protein n=1 Tax=Aliivibrio sp. TaxID=1872443 RepID=UPI001A3B2779|nr:hypothetical protein [Aliivibrio sp.]